MQFLATTSKVDATSKAFSLIRHMQGVKYLKGPMSHDRSRIIMTFPIILSGVRNKKYKLKQLNGVCRIASV